MLLSSRTCERWRLDFVSDALINGRQFRVLTVVDDYSRECLALVVDRSLSGLRVTRELDILIRLRGKPVTVVSGNGSELTSMAVLKWCQETGVEWHYIQPSKPMQNAFCRELQRQLQRRVSSVIGTWLSSLVGHFLVPSGVMLLSALGTLARRIIVVEGVACCRFRGHLRL